MSPPPLLTVRDLRSYLATDQGVVRAVDGVSFTVGEAEILGIVGESGSGKSVTCRTIVGLMPSGMTHISGEVIYHPHGDRNIVSARQAELQALRGSQLAMIFQDPMTALNPVVNVGDQVIEAVQAHAKLSTGEARSRAVSLLRRVGIPAPEQRMRDYPFQFSGGMLQRALIAIALASSPRLLLADEPTTSLDVIIQDQILSLLLELQRDSGMSMILVSHDLGVFVPATMELAILSVFIGGVVGVTFGVFAGLYRNRIADHVLRVASLAGISMPTFWIALVAVYVFFFRLGWFPSGGRLDAGQSPPPHATGLYTVDSLLAG